MNRATGGRRVLVTGGAGYIGAHVVRRLLERGDEPVVLDELSTGRRLAAAPARLHVGSVTERPRLDAILHDERIEAVIHLAGRKSVEESIREPAAYAAANISGSITLLEACVAAGIGSFVFSSTAAVYGIPERLPVREDAVTRPANPYGETKVTVERILHWLAHAGSVRSVSLRYFNAAGAAADGTIGEPWEHATNLIPIVLRAAWRGEPVWVFGTDYPTADGTAVRDYIHVVDLADAHVRALDYLAGGGSTTILNLGTETGVSVAEVIDAAERVTGHAIETRAAPRRDGDPPAVWADASRARETLGWRAERGLVEMLASAWHWHTAEAARGEGETSAARTSPA